METIPEKCMNDNTVSSFCDCIENEGCADVAARDFCERAKSTNYANVTGDNLAELKKALAETDCEGCC